MCLSTPSPLAPLHSPRPPRLPQITPLLGTGTPLVYPGPPMNHAYWHPLLFFALQEVVDKPLASLVNCKCWHQLRHCAPTANRAPDGLLTLTKTWCQGGFTWSFNSTCGACRCCAGLMRLCQKLPQGSSQCLLCLLHGSHDPSLQHDVVCQTAHLQQQVTSDKVWLSESCTVEAVPWAPNGRCGKQEKALSWFAVTKP